MEEASRNHLRYQITQFIFTRGFAPNVTELASIMARPEADIIRALHLLADDHALVLHPNSSEIWIAHPFALFPTLFWVESANQQWWGNCSWCSLGIASLAKNDVMIHTKLKGEKETLTIHIKDGMIAERDYVVHFPVPANKIWENVIHFCANTLLFQNEEEVDQWCLKHRVTKGQVLPVEQVWELAKLWYGYYLDPLWQPKTPEFAESVFAKAGLTSKFWKLT